MHTNGQVSVLPRPLLPWTELTHVLLYTHLTSLNTTAHDQRRISCLLDQMIHRIDDLATPRADFLDLNCIQLSNLVEDFAVV